MKCQGTIPLPHPCTSRLGGVFYNQCSFFCVQLSHPHSLVQVPLLTFFPYRIGFSLDLILGHQSTSLLSIFCPTQLPCPFWYKFVIPGQREVPAEGSTDKNAWALRLTGEAAHAQAWDEEVWAVHYIQCTCVRSRPGCLSDPLILHGSGLISNMENTDYGLMTGARSSPSSETTSQSNHQTEPASGPNLCPTTIHGNRTGIDAVAGTLRDSFTCKSLRLRHRRRAREGGGD